MTDRPRKSAKSKLPERIGRFRVAGVLGSGSQGVVLRAQDEELGREVAIKLLRVGSHTADSAQLMMEARIVSQLQHPNIVTLHELGTFRRLPYLVFEYVRGETLDKVLAASGRLPVATAVIYMSQLLGGVAKAHAVGVAHGDLSPANVMIDEAGVPKVTDFGLSSWYREPARDDSAVRGTLRYMAPEVFRGEGVSPGADVFALGAMLFEMLTGRRLLDGDNKAMVVDALLNAEPQTPGGLGFDSAPRIDAVVHRALDRAPDVRFANAGDMKAELDRYRVPRAADEREDEDRRATINFLVRRFRYAKGFSALSGRISEVLRLTSETSNASAGQLANVIGKDPLLAQRVLGMANSARFRTRKVTTLSRAIVSVGLGEVRGYITRVLVERQFESGSPRVRELLVQGFFAATFAMEIAGHMLPRRREDAYVCALFHDLGRTLVGHYLATEMEAIDHVAETEALDGLTAARKVLGVAYHEIGMTMAEQWQLPPLVREAMRPLPRAEVPVPEPGDAQVALLAAFSNQVAQAAALDPPDAAVERILLLGVRTAAAIPIEPDIWARALEQCSVLTAKYARLVGIEEGESSRVDRLSDAGRLGAVIEAVRSAPPAGEADPDATVDQGVLRRLAG